MTWCFHLRLRVDSPQFTAFLQSDLLLNPLMNLRITGCQSAKNPLPLVHVHFVSFILALRVVIIAFITFIFVLPSSFRV